MITSNVLVKKKKTNTWLYLTFSLSGQILDIQQQSIENHQHQTHTFTLQQHKLGKKRPVQSGHYKQELYWILQQSNTSCWKTKLFIFCVYKDKLLWPFWSNPDEGTITQNSSQNGMNNVFLVRLCFVSSTKQSHWVNFIK